MTRHLRRLVKELQSKQICLLCHQGESIIREKKVEELERVISSGVHE
jgi:anti-sigma28 factor (negative regulator of flagellin synthesis)